MRITKKKVVNYFKSGPGDRLGQHHSAVKYECIRYLYYNKRMDHKAISDELDLEVFHVWRYLIKYKPKRWHKDIIIANLSRLILNDIYLVSKRKGKKRIYSYVEKHLDELH